MNLPSREDLKSGDWEWMHPSSKVKMRWVLQDDGTYECQVLTTAEHQVAVENLPDVKGYATSDLFIKHPTREGYWKIVGRKDDVLILASGEKTVPAPMESVIISNPLVSGVVMFGRARSQVGVLVEAISDVDVTDTKAVEEFRNKVWPDVEAANKDAPAFSRIFKEMILITSPSKPMVRVAKGTVSKKATIKAYEEEINALYNTVEASTKAGSDATPPRSWTEPALIEWLQEQIASISSGVDIIPDKDFFSQGFDSLNATFLRNRILGALYASDQVELRTAAKRIPQNFVFDNPSIHLLAKRVASIVNRPEGETNGSTAHDKKMAIENALKKYSIGLGKTIMTNGAHAENQGEIPSKGSVVLLTGSTGGLGSYLLALLLKNEATAKVYAFNRPSKADAIKGRQASSFEDRALDVTLLDSEKLVFLEGDAAADKCGLDERTYNELRESVTIIIHNAWRLDFNLALSSFEPNIQGTRQLIDLALSSSHPSNPRFLFTSSIASAQGWDQRKGAFPEEVQLDASVAVGSGYGESKYISERLLDMSGLHATSFRIGQIAGGPNGAWSTTDWVPIIAKSSLALAVFPAAQGLVSWMPAEKVAAAILDVAFAEQTPPLALNLAHPRPVSWMDTMEILRDTLLEKKCLHRKDFPFVDFGEWVKRLEKRAQNATAVDFDNIVSADSSAASASTNRDICTSLHSSFLIFSVQWQTPT
ncbi:hypothetical protein SERLA73DRAFT_122132 [Serpula lacrymans var. lacrymans S7.3]|uniref:Polyketide synthase-like phosphopantetheine-binding domain-containing protein n=1 Tax=Serpula lacrymans var. lacrymans (strain S7.3) TaxID=936435 RepID=F8PUK6_SERL3|nr:hypothetical protein SERLA73DRAFT_122132 [Serpula lacrymans var. lacrymans S7.3]